MADAPLDRDAAEQAIEDAVRAWVSAADSGDDVLTGYVLVATAALISNDGATSYHYSASDGQPIHVTRGLIEQVRDWARAKAETWDDGP